MSYDEIECLSQYFQRQLLENPSFFHAYQMDAEEQITNVFWCDARMQVKGFKNRPGLKRTKRLKSCLEKQHSQATSSRAPPKERSAHVGLSSKVFMLAQFCVDNIG